MEALEITYLAKGVTDLIKPKVLGTLIYMIDQMGIHQLPSYICTNEELAESLKLSTRTVIRHIKELEAKGYIFVDRYKCEITGEQMSNEYSLTPFNTGKPNSSFTVDSLRDDEYWNPFSGTYEAIKSVKSNTKDCLAKTLNFLEMEGC
jgi:DNA-binding transcriptional MocR family regulator